jgi:8-oxo-dGTP pyrophosphatase MutT (NUDIX family)
MADDGTAQTRLAATVLLLRDGAAGPEILMIVRHLDIAFAGGALVFPGGRVDAGDAELAEALGLTGPGGALRIAALREAFEETAILLARPTQGAFPDFERRCALRAELNQIGFGAILAQQHLEPAPESLVPFAHWITPPSRAKRFDTYFFLAVAPKAQQALHDGNEAVEAVWISPKQALLEAEAGKRKLVLPTRLNLVRVAQYDSVAAILAHAQETPVVTVRPEIERTPNGHIVRLPIAAGYGSDCFPANDAPAI